MSEGTPFDDMPPQARKNSILVKDEHTASKASMAAVHPHFVESPPPPRASSEAPEGGPNAVPFSLGSATSSTTSIPSAAADRMQNFHLGPQKDVNPGAALAQAQADAQNAQYQQQHQPPRAGGPAPIGPSGTRTPITSPPLSDQSPTSRTATPPVDEHGPPLAARATPKQPSDPRVPMDDGKIHILIGVTGSMHVSCVKPIIAKLQSIYGDRVAFQLIVTPAVEKLVATLAPGAKPASQPSQTANQTQPGQIQPTPAHPTQSQSSVASQSGQPSGQPGSAHPTSFKEKLTHQNTRVWHDSDEWDTWHGRNDPIIHIELRRWADILLIAPLSANTLGKIAMGLCDNLLTNVVRAWNSQYPILIAPAMVTYAYNHPATKRQLQLIREEMKWIEILRPTEKVAGSTGGIGMGGMMPWNEIVDRVVQKLGGYPDEDDEDDEDEDDTPAAINDQKSVSDDDEDDEDEDEQDTESLLQDNYPRTNLSPQGSPI